MRVVEHAPHDWFLLEHDGALLLDINSETPQHAGFSVLLQLDDDEVRAVRAGGRPAIGALANAVRDAGTGWRDSTSRYEPRNVQATLGRDAHAAILAWQRATGCSP